MPPSPDPNAMTSMAPEKPVKPESATLLKDWVIRRMRTSDINGIMPIESVSFGAYHWSPDGFATEISNRLARYWVLIDPNEQGDAQVRGYAGYWHILDEAHITTVAVHPDSRGQSLGEIQLIQLIDDAMARSIKYLTLEVRTSNFSAQQLYYKYAFKCEGIRPKYYQDTNEDALIMTTPALQSELFRDTFRQNRDKLKARVGGEFPRCE